MFEVRQWRAEIRARAVSVEIEIDAPADKVPLGLVQSGDIRRPAVGGARIGLAGLGVENGRVPVEADRRAGWELIGKRAPRAEGARNQGGRRDRSPEAGAAVRACMSVARPIGRRKPPDYAQCTLFRWPRARNGLLDKGTTGVNMERRRLIILGGGFAGLHALRELAEVEELSITLVDGRETSLVKPSLPEVAFSGKSVDHARFPLAEAVRRAGARFIHASARKIDPGAHHVELEGGETLTYDYLLITAGAKKDYDAIPGYREHGYSLCDDREAPRLAARVAELREGPIVIGSARSEWGSRIDVPRLAAPCEGPIGEAMFMLDHELRRRGIRDRTTLRVFSPGEIFFEDVGAAVHDALGPLIVEREIEVHVDRTLVALHGGEVEFEDGERWPSALTLVIPPYVGSPLIQASAGLGDERGFIPTDHAMRHLDYPEIFAAGDGTALAMPKLGHIAIHQADIAAAALRKELTGRGEIPPFEPEIFCIMNRGGSQATMILSDVLFGGKTDRAVSNPLVHAMKWGFDSYYFHTRGHLPPEMAQDLLLRILRS